MTAITTREDRRVIPRFRDYNATLATGELDTVPYTAPIPLIAEELLNKKLLAWQYKRDIPSAADLVAAALVLSKQEIAQEAAGFLIAWSTEVPPEVRAIASAVLPREHRASDKTGPLPGLAPPSPELARALAKAIKAQLIESARNPILWAELSRAYLLIGQQRPAVRAIEHALAQAPDNRFVLRSASRLFVHIDEPDRAHDMLLRSSATQSDPWLLSSELAVADVANRHPKYVKVARNIQASDRFPPFHTSELTSALATLELFAGAHTKSKKLFIRSITAPTDNSLAQATWASQRISSLTIPDRLLELPRTYEARTLHSFHEGDWSKAAYYAQRWLEDEPYSSRPAILGSYIASVGLEQYSLSIWIARQGLQSNPNAPALSNNIAFALANMGQLKEAAHTLDDAPPPPPDSDNLCAFTATRGLIAFREGNLYEGRSLYRQAIELATKNGFDLAHGLALFFLAREEARAATPLAPETVFEALSHIAKVSEPEKSWLAAKLAALVKPPS